MKPFLRSAYNYDGDSVSKETGLVCDEESMAIQSAKDECDINTIVKRFGLTGEVPGNLAMPLSGDFVDVVDFHTAMNLVRKSEEEFMRVPAEIRARFNNDPQLFTQFFESPENQEEAIKMGLAVRRPEPPKTPEA